MLATLPAGGAGVGEEVIAPSEQQQQVSPGKSHHVLEDLSVLHVLHPWVVKLQPARLLCSNQPQGSVEPGAVFREGPEGKAELPVVPVAVLLPQQAQKG
jgi:hypothetical protein